MPGCRSCLCGILLSRVNKYKTQNSLIQGSRCLNRQSRQRGRKQVQKNLCLEFTVSSQPTRADLFLPSSIRRNDCHPSPALLQTGASLNAKALCWGSRDSGWGAEEQAALQYRELQHQCWPLCVFVFSILVFFVSVAHCTALMII